MQIAEYVQQRDGEYYVGSTRVTLRSIIADWKRGRVAEQIAADFPSVPLVAIYGAITAYLEREQEFDAHFRASDAVAAQHQASVEAAHPEFFAAMRQRVERVRPHIQRELRELGILPKQSDDDESASDGPVT